MYKVVSYFNSKDAIDEKIKCVRVHEKKTNVIFQINTHKCGINTHVAELTTNFIH